MGNFVPWEDWPEGIELYRWVHAPPSYWEYNLTAPAEMSCFASEKPDPMDHVAFRPIRIVPRRGRWGWSEELRVGVCFFGASLPVFVESAISDKALNGIVFEEIQCAAHEAWQRLLGKIDGECWKRSDG